MRRIGWKFTVNKKGEVTMNKKKAFKRLIEVKAEMEELEKENKQLRAYLMTNMEYREKMYKDDYELKFINRKTIVLKSKDKIIKTLGTDTFIKVAHVNITDLRREVSQKTFKKLAKEIIYVPTLILKTTQTEEDDEE